MNTLLRTLVLAGIAGTLILVRIILAPATYILGRIR
tara:strand:+ start:357 stop:464 length:108 start_codon:yes stop_codon:yes gene_type:complete